MGAFAESPDSITIDEAFQRLHLGSKEKNGYISCEGFNIALREGRIQLHADGDKVEPSFFVAHLLISAERASDGGWTAKMTATRALERPVNKYEWSVSALDVGRLLVEKPKRKTSGPKPTGDWYTV